MDFSKFPPEIQLKIASKLKRSSYIALALTCKTAWKELHKTFPHDGLEYWDQAELLMLLARDLPDWFVCFWCQKLVHFPSNSSLEVWREHKHRSCFREGWAYDGRSSDSPLAGTRCSGIPQTHLDDNAFAWRLWGMNGPTILFNEAALVMKRHTGTPSCGLPMNVLEHHEKRTGKLSCNDKVKGSGHSPTQSSDLEWKYELKTTPKIIHNELYISHEHSLEAPPLSTHNFNELLGQLRLPVCYHIFNQFATGQLRAETNHLHTRQSYALTNIVDARQNFCVSDKPLANRIIPLSYYKIKPLIRSCRDCHTDYSLVIVKGNHKMGKGWKLKLITYHCLGECQSPFEGRWQDLVKLPHFFTRYREDSPRQGNGHPEAGSVAREWQRAKGGDQEAFKALWFLDSHEWCLPFHLDSRDDQPFPRGGWPDDQGRVTEISGMGMRFYQRIFCEVMPRWGVGEGMVPPTESINIDTPLFTGRRFE